MPDGSLQFAEPNGTEEDKRLPVTLLSGFLGSGKTTLLSNILRSKDHGMRCAVIVNDMGALNIDAALVKSHRLTRTDEKVVQMQNGCICCTLRADLLEEVAKLAEMGEFDYLLIESSGISEPIQVAETFTPEFASSLDPDATVQDIADQLPDEPDQTVEQKLKLAELIAAGGLNKVARLDTCVSVVDCTTFFGDFETADFLTDRNEDVDPEDERNITDLLTDQIEFANVILLNKTDVVSAEQANKAEQVVRALNREAKIYRTTYSHIDLHEILNTKLFDFEKAAQGAGWLQSIREAAEWTDKNTGKVKMIPKPETEEYGVRSFVWTARRPFHPKRLWEMLQQPFCILQDQVAEEETDDDDDDDDKDGDEDMSAAAVDEGKAEKEGKEESKQEVLARMRREKEELDLPKRVAFKKTSPIWKGLLRSKGFVWLATRFFVSGEWSQAGVMFTLSGGSPWMCAMPEDQWPTDDPELIEAIKSDFEGKWGDRRQEVVFIGQDIDEPLLRQTLEAALLNDQEWAQWEKTMSSRRADDYKIQKLYDLYDDGWEEWENPLDGDEGDEHGHDHHNHNNNHNHIHANGNGNGHKHAHIVKKQKLEAAD